MSRYIQFAALSIFLLGFESARAEEWPIKKFVVQERITPGQEQLARFFNDQGMQLVAEVSPEMDALYADIEGVLSSSAEFFEASGFAPPNLASTVRLSDGSLAHPVYLAETLRVNGEEVAGYHSTSRCLPGLGLVRERYIFLSLREIANPNASVLTAHGKQTIAHELFHAVQQGSELFLDPCNEVGLGSWITEGTARAAGWAAAIKNSPHVIGEALRNDNDFGLMETVWGLRNHSRRLTVPHDNSRPVPADIAYRTAGFWLYLAEWFAGRGMPETPGINPYDIGYLSVFFANAPSSRDCDGASAPCQSEIAWLDQNTRSVMGTPLREIFARFIQSYAIFGAYRAPAFAFWDQEWLDNAFDPCQSIELSPSSPVKKKMIANFEPVSAQCFEIKPTGFGNGFVNVIVTVRMPSGAAGPLLEQLTSVTADGTNRLRTAETDHLPGDMQRAEWKYRFLEVGALPTNDETDLADKGTLLLLTNVADDAEHTGRFHWQDGTELEVTFTALHEYAAIGGAPVDGGAVADAIDTPLELEFSKFNARVGPGQAGATSGQTGSVGEVFSEGIVNPCFLEITTHRDFVPGRSTAETLYIAMQTSGPLGAGVYPVRPYQDDPSDHATAFPEGEAVASVYLHDVAEDGGWMNWESGAVRIHHIDRHMVIGRLSGVAHYRKDSAIEESRTLAARFAIRLDTVRRRCAAR